MTDQCEYDKGMHSPLPATEFQSGSSAWEGAVERDRITKRNAALNTQYPLSNSTVSSAGTAQGNPGGLVIALLAEMCGVGYFSWSFLYPFINSALANVTVTSNQELWVTIINLGIAIALAIYYAVIQMRLLTKPSTRTLTKFILTLIWSYVFYGLARHWDVTSLIWLSVWTTTGAVISYGEKTALGDGDPDADEIYDSLGLFTAFEIIAVIFVSLCTLLQPELGIQPGYAIAIGVASGFGYKYLIRFLARTRMVYPVAIASIALWVALTYWLSSSVMQLGGFWTIGLSVAMLAWVSHDRKRSMIKKGFSSWRVLLLRWGADRG